MQGHGIHEMQGGLENKQCLIKDIESKLFYNQSKLDTFEAEIQ